MPDDDSVSQGYLLLADISGYTAFLTGTELEHAHAIIRELTKLIRERLAPPMRFVKLEGDAVFCYADAVTFADGERFVELIEVCYFNFANQLLDMTRETTCRCDACRAIPTLGLKFVTHFGSFMVERDDGREDLAGPDVILAHRLLKNSISDADGPQAYAFFTGACMKRMPSWFTLPEHSEVYESFGEIAGGVHDLKPVLTQMREVTREYLDSADADFEFSAEFPFPPAVVWQYCVDPDKRLRWQGAYQTAVEKHPNALGRTGLGSTSHCAHADGKEITRRYIDWRPFEYFTVRYAAPEHLPDQPFVVPGMTETTNFAPTVDGGTLLHQRSRVDNRSPVTMDPYREKLLPLQRATGPAAIAALLAALEEDAAAAGPTGAT